MSNNSSMEQSIFFKCENNVYSVEDIKTIDMSSIYDDTSERKGMFQNLAEFNIEFSVDEEKVNAIFKNIETEEFIEATLVLGIYTNKFKEEDIYAFKSYLFLDLRVLLKLGYIPKKIETKDNGTYITVIKYDNRDKEEYERQLRELYKFIEEE